MLEIPAERKLSKKYHKLRLNIAKHGARCPHKHGAEDVSALQSICCFCRGVRFSPKHLHGSKLQQAPTPFGGDLTTSSGHLGPQVHMWYRYINVGNILTLVHTHTHIHIHTRAQPPPPHTTHNILCLEPPLSSNMLKFQTQTKYKGSQCLFLGL